MPGMTEFLFDLEIAVALYLAVFLYAGAVNLCRYDIDDKQQDDDSDQNKEPIGFENRPYHIEHLKDTALVYLLRRNKVNRRDKLFFLAFLNMVYRRDADRLVCGLPQSAQ